MGAVHPRGVAATMGLKDVEGLGGRSSGGTMCFRMVLLVWSIVVNVTGRSGRRRFGSIGGTIDMGYVRVDKGYGCVVAE